ncbi:isopenicillin N synthase family dioxygenase [Aspergillus brunneoviolaceus CBS 621.78]|uniref:Clavaminate synthase-like protein n=1 Tax=Aspergillus brunneoviolaceus CBS 621.78 TaxID=1450534 RepID=A0ACD1G6C2_9EURO|nr:Clavaminate synthase-like protein [Aspergillus brunneoviolaceus CBS 621.78]RAH44770.1 Clavaminate synthase-like protein [Aspergillus brunneoviolaceus CBS 621.78]
MQSDDVTPGIPIVDISPFLDPNASTEARLAGVAALSQAAHIYGFFNLVGHGIPDWVLEEIMTVNKMFFNMSEEDKMEVWINKSLGRSFRGYEPPGIQTHHPGLLPDIKETFMVGREVPEEDPDCGSFSTGPNLWPSRLPKAAFQDRVMAYQSRMVSLVRTILDILAQGLPAEWGCSPEVFHDLLVKPSIPMRFLHYAPVQAEEDARQFGVADHTDFGCVSIILQEPGTTGLEVYHPPSESWVPVPVVENAFVVNMGDMMQRYTGGFYRSARHRVLTNRLNHRYSVAFFLNGNLQLNAKALDGSGGETVVGEYIRGRLIETMGSTGRVLQREVTSA